MEDSLGNAIVLREQGDLQEAQEMLVRLVEANPEDALLNYHCAWSCDALGLEHDAIHHYVKAMHLGLPDEEMQGAILGLGSTYRALGMYDDAREMLQQGVETFPGNHALMVFYAMTLYNLRLYDKATEHVLMVLAETSGDHRIQRYRRALEFYASRLDETW